MEQTTTREVAQSAAREKSLPEFPGGAEGYARFVSQAVFRRLGERNEDLEQEACAVVLARLASNPPENLAAFTQGVCNTLVRSYLREKGRRREVSLDGAGEVVAAAVSLEVTLEKEEQLERVRAAVAVLPSHLKEVLALHLAGVPRRDIASALFISTRAVGNRLAVLRSRLGESS